MNRKDFFKKLGIGLGAVIIAPEVLADIKIRKVSKNEEYYKKLKAGEHGPYTLEREDALYVFDSGWWIPDKHKTYAKASLEADFLLAKYINDEIWLM